MNIFRYAMRATRREFTAGDLLTIFAALALGVAVMTAVGTLVNRVNLALNANAAEILGGDLGLRGNQDIPQTFADEAQKRGLQSARMVSFPTMLFHNDANQMANIKAVNETYPLRGNIQTSNSVTAAAENTAAPPSGHAYADARLLNALQLKIGDSLELGTGQVQITHILQAEPDASGEMMQLAPTLMVNRADVDNAELLGPGSRASYRLMFAGSPQAIADFSQWLKPQSQQFRLLSIEDTQRGLSDSFDRAGRFLALTALLAVLLAGVATALAANRFALHRIDQVAILRCLGAKQHEILRALSLQLLLLAIPACLLGIMIGMAAQAGLVTALGSLVPSQLPLPQATPALTGAAIGLLLLLGFGLPPLLRLRNTPPMRVLNRSLSRLPPTSWLVYLAGIAATVALASYATGDAQLTAYVLGGLSGLALVTAIIGAVLLWGIQQLQSRLRGSWKLGLASLTRRRALSVVQLVGLSLSLCALLLLAVIGPGLLNQWHDRLPANTPNYFLMGIQPDQADAVQISLQELGATNIALEPFGTARLVAINDKPPVRVNQEGDSDDNGYRPVNFTWRHDFPQANRLLKGDFWVADSQQAEVSIEEGWAKRYGLQLGDTLTLQVGEQTHTYTYSNLRKADWSTFRVNFFLLLNAGAVEQDMPYSLISSFHLPPSQTSALGQINHQYPNASLLDIDAILNRVRDVITQVNQAIQLVMSFSLLSGILVLLAALQATASERRYDNAILRTLGARRDQLRNAMLIEFGALGILAAILATFAAAVIGKVIAVQAFDMPLTLPWSGLLIGAMIGVILSVVAGWWGTRRILHTPPILALRQD